MYYFDSTYLTFNGSQPVKSYPLGGFSDFALHTWLRGSPGAVVYQTIYFDNLQAFAERIVLDAGGFYMGVKTYPVAAPTMSIVYYNSTSQMESQIRVYASCCGNDETPPMKPGKPKKLELKALTPKFGIEPRAKAKAKKK